MMVMPISASGWRQGGRRAARSLRVRPSSPASVPGRRVGIERERFGRDHRSSIRGSRML